MKHPELYIDLSFLNANYGKLPYVIEKLETRNICIYDAISIFENTIQSIENVQGEIGNKGTQTFHIKIFHIKHFHIFFKYFYMKLFYMKYFYMKCLCTLESMNKWWYMEFVNFPSNFSE